MKSQAAIRRLKENELQVHISICLFNLQLACNIFFQIFGDICLIMQRSTINCDLPLFTVCLVNAAV